MQITANLTFVIRKNDQKIPKLKKNNTYKESAISKFNDALLSAIVFHANAHDTSVYGMQIKIFKIQN